MTSESERFEVTRRTVTDTGSGLMWTRDAAPGEFPMTWREALAFVAGLSERRHLGCDDWRLPNRRELFSLVCHDRTNPALPANHPFEQVFTGYYWTATTCCRLPDQAWYVHLGGARVFKGMKHGSYMVWPVRTAAADRLPPRTGQQTCYAENNAPVVCAGAGQDGDLQCGRPWPAPRFEVRDDGVYDCLTGLIWGRSADLTHRPVNWESARRAVTAANQGRQNGHAPWRLPTVRELESLCDLGRHSPALPADHPFEGVKHDYWTGTTSRYESRYAWVLYLEDGAVGVGFKTGSEFYVWPVRGGQA